MNAAVRKAAGRQASSAEPDDKPKRHPTADAGEGRRPENRVDVAAEADMNSLLRGARRE